MLHLRGVHLQKGLNVFLIECESVQSEWCFMVRTMQHRHHKAPYRLHTYTSSSIVRLLLVVFPSVNITLNYLPEVV